MALGPRGPKAQGGGGGTARVQRAQGWSGPGARCCLFRSGNPDLTDSNTLPGGQRSARVVVQRRGNSWIRWGRAKGGTGQPGNNDNNDKIPNDNNDKKPLLQHYLFATEKADCSPSPSSSARLGPPAGVSPAREAGGSISLGAPPSPPGGLGLTRGWAMLGPARL